MMAPWNCPVRNPPKSPRKSGNFVTNCVEGKPLNVGAALNNFDQFDNFSNSFFINNSQNRICFRFDRFENAFKFKLLNKLQVVGGKILIIDCVMIFRHV